MGYFTKHKIRIINEYNTKRNLKLLLKRLIEITNYTFIISGNTIHDIHSCLNFGNGCKWYDCRRDMELISMEFPQFEIQIKGLGEEGEIWEEIYHNGDVEYIDCDEFSDIESDIEEESENSEEIIDIKKKWYKQWGNLKAVVK